MKILKTFLFVLFAFLIANISSINASSVTGSVTVTVTAATTYTVTPSAGANGTISPNIAQSGIAKNATVSFTVTPNINYIASVGGTCGGSLVGNNYTTNAITADCTVVASFASSAIDSCGLGSDPLIPQNPEPTGTSACIKGTLNSNSPADTTLAWNWSCGTVTSCSAPKYGCTTVDDINYNASGPSNTYGCANKCSYSTDTNYNTAPCSHICTNGGTSWPTCNPLGTCSNGANNPPTCNQCTAPLIWNTSSVSCVNPLSISVNPSTYSVTLPSSTISATYALTNGTSANTTCRLLDNLGNPLNTYSSCTGTMSVVAPSTASGGAYAYSIQAFKSQTNETKTSNQFIVTVNPATGLATPTLTVACRSQTRIDASWNTVAGATKYQIYRNGSLVYNNTGTVFMDIPLIANTTYSYVVRASDNSGNYSASSAPVSQTTDSSCVPPASASNSISGTNCTIPDGSSTCYTNISWNIADSGLIDPKLNKSNCFATTIAYGASGNVNYLIPYGATGLYACDGSTAKKNTSVTASCSGTSAWNGSTCAISVPPSPATITSCSASSYKIAKNASVNVIWTSANATSCTLKAGADSTDLVPPLTPSAGTNITKTLWPTKTVRYTLVCSGPGGSSAPCNVPEIKVGTIDPTYQEN